MTYQNATPRDAAVVSVAYEPHTTGLPFETFTLSSLIERRGHVELSVHQRLEFELLVFCTGGSGQHEVDFERVGLVPGRIVHVRPGQVHRWLLRPTYEAQLFLIQARDDRADWSAGARIVDTDAELYRDLQRIVALADRALRDSPLSVRSLEAVRDLLVALLGLDQPWQHSATHRDSIYRDFERLLANTTPPPRTVGRYSNLLGCSSQTLTRACVSARGVSPKTLVDQAVALAAQRLLSEPGATATAVATALGFTEPSHFTRFFKRVTGEAPSTFASTFATRSGRSTGELNRVNTAASTAMSRLAR